jgi:hypothetical protein
MEEKWKRTSCSCVLWSDIDESIHSATKKKYFKELIKDIGREELPEWVTIYDIRKATVK